MAVHLGVIGGFVAGDIPVKEESHDEQDDHGNHDRDAEFGALGARRAGIKILLRRGQGPRSRICLLRRGGRALGRRFHRLLFAFQISFHSLFSIPDGAGQFDFGEVVRVQALDVTFVRGGDRFLRLHNLQIVGDSGSEAVLRLGESLLGQVYRAACDFDLLRGSIEIEQRGTDFVIDASSEIAELRARLLQLGLGFEHVAVNFAAGKNRDVETSVDLPGSVGVSRRHADVAVVGIHVERGIASGSGGAARQFGGAYLSQGGLIVGARGIGALQIYLDRKRSQGSGKELSRSERTAARVAGR